MDDKKKKQLSDSDLARLEELANEKEHEEWLRERRAKILESIKRAALWVGAVGAAVTYTWQALERILAWFKGH